MSVKTIDCYFDWRIRKMESIADFEKWIETARSELGQQTIVIRQLAFAFAKCDVQLVRRDQVALLRILKSRITEEVENLKRIESAAQMGSNDAILLSSGAAFALGSLFAAASGRKDAIHIGARMASSVLSKKVPFGTILITIDTQGIPEGVKVISVSRLARESNMSEPDVEKNMKNDGYLPMTPEEFAKFLERVDSEILNGSVSLPTSVDEVIKRIA